jgi:hypothetical protein
VSKALQRESDPARQPESAKKDSSPTVLDAASRAALNQQVANAVTKGLGYFGGGPVVESLVYILELEHSVDLNSLANNLDALRAALQKMFGGAAYVIEGKIAESLAKQLGVDPDGKKLDELVKILSNRIEEFIPAGNK